MGSSLSAQQDRLLVAHADQVLLMFDSDDAGAACTNDCLWRLGCGIWIRAVGLPQGIQPDQLSREEISHFFEA